MSAEETTTEWGVRWPDAIEVCNSEDRAQRVAQMFPGQGAVVSRTVTRSPWTDAS